MMMRPGDILGRIFYVVTEINHRNLSTEHTEDTDFLSTEDTFFLVATLEILEEIFFKMLLRKKSIIGINPRSTRRTQNYFTS